MQVQVIDDSTGIVAYSPGDWIKAGVAPAEYMGTTHGTSSKGARAVLVFNGTSISVRGTIANPSKSTYGVDDDPLVTVNLMAQPETLYKQLFFHATNLSQGQHKLVITLVKAELHFWLDYFTVRDTSATSSNIPSITSPSQMNTIISTVLDNPPPDPTRFVTLTTTISPSTTTASPALGSTLFYVDDQNPEVSYSGIWFLGGTSEEHEGTTHGTQASQATATLTFTGTTIAVFGTIAGSRPGLISRTSTYTLDGGEPVTVTPSPAETPLYQQVLFQSSELQDGQHTLVVTSGDGDAPFWLDFFQVNGTLPTSSPTSSVGKTSSIELPSTSMTLSASSVNSSSNKGAIAGGVIGGLLIIALLVAFIVYRRRRRPFASYIPTNPESDLSTRAVWTNEKLTMRRNRAP